MMLRRAQAADLERLWDIRLQVNENTLRDRALISDAEFLWYIQTAITWVSVDDNGINGFACANHQTALIWALFVANTAHRKGCGRALMTAVMHDLQAAGHLQCHLSTTPGTAAETFYRSTGWIDMGVTRSGEIAFRKPL